MWTGEASRHFHRTPLTDGNTTDVTFLLFCLLPSPAAPQAAALGGGSVRGGSALFHTHKRTDGGSPRGPQLRGEEAAVAAARSAEDGDRTEAAGDSSELIPGRRRAETRALSPEKNKSKPTVPSPLPAVYCNVDNVVRVNSEDN